MHIAVVGTGNVGSALLLHLAEVPSIDSILVMNLKDEWSQAAILDVASANASGAQCCEVAALRRLGEADVVAITSGAQMQTGQTGDDVREANAQMMDTILDAAALKPTAVVIGLATPVDETTAHIGSRLNLPSRQVLGFGGDLDRNRLAYALATRGHPGGKIAIVGEHGARAIPVYEGEHDYSEIALQVRSFLANITAQGGSPRNLATGKLLARLIDSIVHDRRRLHYVSGFHPEYRRYLTWPFPVGRMGVGEPKRVRLGPNARTDLQTLLESKPW